MTNHQPQSGCEIFVMFYALLGWGYAIARLPQNITSCFVYDLAQSLPPFLASTLREMNAQRYIHETASCHASVSGSAQMNGVSIASSAGGIVPIVHSERRRLSWQLGGGGHGEVAAGVGGAGGKTLMLMCDEYTDVLDFCTCLCTHILEARKLRGKVQGMIAPMPIMRAFQRFGFPAAFSNAAEPPTVQDEAR